jgi:hypothetical protein
MSVGENMYLMATVIGDAFGESICCWIVTAPLGARFRKFGNIVCYLPNQIG